jgi:MFS family permease
VHSARQRSYAEFLIGWKPLLAAAVGVTCGATMLPFNILGAVVNPLNAEFGWGRGEIQFCYFVFAVASALLYPWVGRRIDVLGSRTVALVGLPCFSLAFALVACVGNSLWVFYGAWALVGVLGAGTAPITFTRAVNAWFVENRGLALAISLLFGGLASAIYQVLSTALAEAFGWRAAFMGFALVPLCVAWPLAWFYFREPGPGEAPVVESAERTIGRNGSRARSLLVDARFIALATAILILTFSISGTMLNLKPLLGDRGLAPETAAFVAAVVGIAVSVSRLVTGYLIDRFWAPAVAFPFLAAPAIACLLLGRSDLALPAAVVAGILIGLATGAETDLMAFLTARYFGLANYGSLYGVLFAIFIVASGIAPFAFGAVFDYFGSYAPALTFAGVSFVAGAFLLLRMGPYPHAPAVGAGARNANHLEGSA